MEDLWTFCDEHMPDMARKVGSLHQTARNLIVKGIEIYRGDATVLETIQTALAQAYRTDWRQGVSKSRAQDQRLVTDETSPTMDLCGRTPLLTLAAAAHHVQENAASRTESSPRLASEAVTEVAQNQNLGDVGVQTSLPYEGSSNVPEISHGDALTTMWPSDQSLWSGNLGPSECQIVHAQDHFQDTQMSTGACAVTFPELTDTWSNDLYSSWFSKCVQDFC